MWKDMRVFLFGLLVVGPLTVCVCFGAWEVVSTPTTADLYDVHFTTEDIGFAVGDSGTILRTVDSGETWTKLNTGSSASFKAVRFANSDTGIVVSGGKAILRTTDGGENWVAGDPGVVGVTLLDVFLLNGRFAVAVGEQGNVLRTTDGGQSWSRNSVGISVILEKVHFNDGGEGIAIGRSGQLYWTADSGSSWTLDSSFINEFGKDSIPGYSIWPEIGGVMVLGKDTLVAAGTKMATWGTSMPFEMDEFVYTSFDKGQSWNLAASTELTVGEARGIWDIVAAANDVWVAVGNGGLTMESKDGGDSWEVDQLPTNIGVKGAATFGDGVLAVGDSGKIAKREVGTGISSVVLPGNREGSGKHEALDPVNCGEFQNNSILERGLLVVDVLGRKMIEGSAALVRVKIRQRCPGSKRKDVVLVRIGKGHLGKTKRLCVCNSFNY